MLYCSASQAMLAGVAQLVEHLLAKEKVAGSNPVSRSIRPFVINNDYERTFFVLPLFVYTNRKVLPP